MTNISTIVFKSREEIDILRYDNLVENTGVTNVYCLSWYLDAVSDNWGCLIKGDYEAVLPIPYTLKMKQKIIYQPFFSREINLFTKEESDNKDLAIEMINALPKQFNKIDFATSSFSSMTSLGKVDAVFQRLHLKEDYSFIRANYSKNAKRLINKAGKFDLSIIDSDNVADFISFFKKYTGNQVDYNQNNYHKLERLIKYIIEHQKGKLLQVVKDGKVLAQGVFIYQKNKVTYLKGSVNELGKAQGAMFFLMDNVINSSIKKGIEWFDFGGSNIESIAAFYKKFGAEDTVYFRYSRNDLPWILKKGKMIRDSIKK